MVRLEDPRLSIVSTQVRKPCSTDVVQGLGSSCQDRKTIATAKGSPRVCQGRWQPPQPMASLGAGGCQRLLPSRCFPSVSVLSCMCCLWNNKVPFLLNQALLPYPLCPHTHTCTHTYTHAHTCTHTYTRAHVHTHTHSLNESILTVSF